MYLRGETRVLVVCVAKVGEEGKVGEGEKIRGG